MLSVPVLWPSTKTPILEVEAIKTLYAHLAGLKYNVKAWDAGLQLYRLSKSRPHQVPKDVVWRWQFVAASECVFALHHLKKRVEKIRGVLIRRAPSLQGSIDTSKIRNAAKLLDEYFPEIDGLRDAMAHAGEFDAHPEQHAPDGMFALTGFREADTFSAPFKKRLHHLDITDESLSRIEQVVSLVLSGFDRAAKDLELEGHLE